MKKKTIVLDILLDVLLVLILVLLSASLFAGEQPDDPLSQRVMKLKKDLELDETQTAEVRKILEKDQNQAVEDRKAFKENALNLIDAAFDRRTETNLAIKKLLNPDQKIKFKKVSRMSIFEHELFILTEGLLLTPDQAFTVEGILIDYFNTLDEMIPEEMRDRGDRGMGEGPEAQGRPIGTGMGRMGGGGYFRGPIKNLQSKSDRAIKKILTKEQKKLFKQIKEDRRKKMKKRRKEMRKRYRLPAP